MFIAIDNTTNECFVEEFATEKEALAWLQHSSKIYNGDNEISDEVFKLKVDYNKKHECEL